MASNKRNAENKESEISLDWKDYIAIAIAMLESNLLPFILLIAILIITALLILAL